MSFLRSVELSTQGPQKEIFFEKLYNGSNSNMNVDGSGTEVVFKASPPAGEVWRIASMSLYIEDNGTFDAEQWGNGITLTNGIMPRLSINGTVKDMIGFGVKSSGALSSLCDGINHLTFGTGNEILTVEWEFIKLGQYIRLTEDDEIQLVVRDDLTSLVAQYSTIKGYKE